MVYNFDQLPNRLPFNSAKWSRNTRPYQKGDLLPLWVADSDLTAPEPVKAALHAYVEHGVFGYAGNPSQLTSSVKGWLSKHHQWEIDESWLSFPGGVVAAIYATVKAYTEPGDGIILHNPIYPPFAGAINNTGREIIWNPLKTENGRYVMDFDHLRSLFAAEKKPKMMIFCSPHNAAGRVWEMDELKTLVEIMLENDCMMISDEIHYDLVWDGKEHITMGRLGEEISQKMVMLSAASKTFNVAGLHCSFAVIPNEELRKKFQAQFAGATQASYFGKLALQACYTEGEEYLEQLKAHITKNLDFFIPAINAIAPLQVTRPEGTYLVWVDCRGLKKDQPELMRWLMEDMKIWVNDGATFGPGGEGFVRFNLATPTFMLEEAVERLSKGVADLKL